MSAISHSAAVDAVDRAIRLGRVPRGNRAHWVASIELKGQAALDDLHRRPMGEFDPSRDDQVFSSTAERELRTPDSRLAQAVTAAGRRPSSPTAAAARPGVSPVAAGGRLSQEDLFVMSRAERFGTSENLRAARDVLHSRGLLAADASLGETRRRVQREMTDVRASQPASVGSTGQALR